MARLFNGTTDKITAGTGYVWAKTGDIYNSAALDSHPTLFQLDNGDILCGFCTSEDGGNFRYKKVTSTDGGGSWASKIQIASSANNIFEGSFVQFGAGAGTLGCVYGDGDSVIVNTSSDRGANWGGSPVTITSGLGADPHPSAVIMADGKILTVYRKQSTTPDTIVGKISTNASDLSAWDAEFTIATASGRDAFDPHVIKLSNNDLLIAYVSYDTGGGGRELRVQRSTDNGANWSAATTVYSNVFYETNNPTLMQIAGTSQVVIFFPTSRGVSAEADRWLYCGVSKNYGNSFDYFAYMYGDSDPHRVHGIQLADGSIKVACCAKDGGDANYHISQLTVPSGWPKPNVRNLLVYTAWAWVYYSGPNAAQADYVMAKNGVDRVYIYVNDSGGAANQWRSFLNRATAAADYETNTSLVVDNAWRFIAIVADGGLGSPNKIKFYQGDTPATVAALTTSVSTDGSGLYNDDTAGSVIIGSRSTDNNRVFTGRIAYAGLHGNALTLQQLKALATCVPPPAVGITPAAWWPLFGVSSPEVDWSNGGNTGTLTGTSRVDGPPTRALWGGAMAAPAATSAVSIALTGVSGTGAVGSLSPSMSVGLSGVSGTGAIGSVAPSISVALSGVQATGSVGTLTPVTGTVVALTGVSGTGAVGSLGVSVSVALSGVSATGLLGTLTPPGASVPRTVFTTKKAKLRISSAETSAWAF